MDANRFDRITRWFASDHVSRRAVIAHGSVGFAAGALTAAGLARSAHAQDATPATSEAGPEEGPTMLFLQAFQSGTVAPKEGDEDRYILTLEQGLGHTVYFSDRPDRIVGAAPTPQFLADLGFTDDNPPNAALVVETETGQTEIAVLELFSPQYDNATHTATYEVAVLTEFEREEGAFAETDADLAELLPEFGAAHLFIDSCPPKTYAYCHPNNDPNAVWVYRIDTGLGCCGGGKATGCGPCSSGANWTDDCNATVTVCAGNCVATTMCGY
jgi:hypothetical protein